MKAAIIALGFIAASFSTAAVADVFTFSASAAPGASPDANGSVNAWTTQQSTGDGNQAGNFLGDSGANGGGSAAGAGTSAWALYANSGATSSATASISTLIGRPLTLVGDSVSLDFDNGWIESGGSVGIRFFNNASQAQATFQFTNGTSDYKIVDQAGTFGTGISFTANGFNLKLTLDNAAGGYTLDVGNSTFASRTLALGTADISSIQVFNSNAGGGSERNVYFNNLVIAAVPEVSPAIAIPFVLALCGGAAQVRRRFWSQRASA